MTMQQLHVASWNLKSCEFGLAQVVHKLRALDADVVALQEVDRGTLRAGGLDQASFIARETGYPFFHYFKAIDCFPQGEFGLALMSKHPLTDPRRELLPVKPGFQQRILGSAVLHVGGARLSVNVAHLTHVFHERKLRLRQVERILEVLRADPLPKILLGDFNDVRMSPMYRAVRRELKDVMRTAGPRARRGTFPLVPKLFALPIDYIFASEGVAPMHARIIRTRASDHHLLSAKVAPLAALEALRQAG